jgi:hypothetical protein
LKIASREGEINFITPFDEAAADASFSVGLALNKTETGSTPGSIHDQADTLLARLGGEVCVDGRFHDYDGGAYLICAVSWEGLDEY